MIYPLNSPLIELVLVSAQRRPAEPPMVPLNILGAAPDAQEDLVYAGATYTATGGVPPYSFDISAGALPPGLTLSSGGVLSGTPTTVGTYGFTVRVTDSLADESTLGESVIIFAALDLSNAASDATTGVAYSHTYTATGGVAPYSYAVASGTLPAGLSLSSGGILSGTPSAAGTSTFSVQVTDALGNTDTLAESVTMTAVQTPADFPGLTGWFDATDASKIFEGTELATMTPVNANGDPVYAIGSRAGSMHPSYFAGPNSGNNRTYSAAGLGGKDAVNFATATNQLRAYYQAPSTTQRTIANFVTSTAFTVVWCGRITAVTTNSANPWENHFVFRGNAGYMGLHLRNNGGTYTAIAYVWDSGPKTVSVTITGQINTLATLAMRLSAGNLQVRVNGGAWATLASVGAIAVTNDTPELAMYVDKFRQLALYNQALSDSDITTIENYMAA